MAKKKKDVTKKGYALLPPPDALHDDPLKTLVAWNEAVNWFLYNESTSGYTLTLAEKEEFNYALLHCAKQAKATLAVEKDFRGFLGLYGPGILKDIVIKSIVGAYKHKSKVSQDAMKAQKPKTEGYDMGKVFGGEGVLSKEWADQQEHLTTLQKENIEEDAKFYKWLAKSKKPGKQSTPAQCIAEVLKKVYPQGYWEGLYGAQPNPSPQYQQTNITDDNTLQQPIIISNPPAQGKTQWFIFDEGAPINQGLGPIVYKGKPPTGIWGNSPEASPPLKKKEPEKFQLLIDMPTRRRLD